MAKIRRLVLDTLKAHEPNIIDLAKLKTPPGEYLIAGDGEGPATA